MHNKPKMKQIANKPNFLGIGAPKTATTWLSHCLSKHSQISIPPVAIAYEVNYFNRCQNTTTSFLRSCYLTLPQFMKETIKGTRVEKPFFSFFHLWLRLPPQSALFVPIHLLTFPYVVYRLLKRKETNNLGWHTKFWLGRLKWNPEKWYASLFEPTGQQICGDITPAYCVLPDSSIEYMLSFNKDMRFIYLVRNPIELAWSHISFLTEGSLSLCDVQKYLWVQNYSYYLRIIKKYLKYVAPENLFLGFYEDILFHPNRFLAAVQEFLDVPVEDIGSKPQLTGGYKGINTEYAVYLAQRNIRKIEEMASIFGGYAQFWLDVASELCQTDTTIHSDETFLSTPFATNDLWSSRWECSGAKDFQSGPLSSLPCVNKLIP